MAASQLDCLTPALCTSPLTSAPKSSPSRAYPPLLDWLSRMRKAPPGFPGSNSNSSAFSRLRPSYSHLGKSRRGSAWGRWPPSVVLLVLAPGVSEDNLLGSAPAFSAWISHSQEPRGLGASWEILASLLPRPRLLPPLCYSPVQEPPVAFCFF